VGLKEIWSRFTGGDKLERVEEEMETDRSEQPERPEDYEGMKDDVAIRERFYGTDFDANRGD
jgi:hypothetical protein